MPGIPQDNIMLRLLDIAFILSESETPLSREDKSAIGRKVASIRDAVKTHKMVMDSQLYQIENILDNPKAEKISSPLLVENDSFHEIKTYEWRVKPTPIGRTVYDRIRVTVSAMPPNGAALITATLGYPTQEGGVTYVPANRGIGFEITSKYIDYVKRSHSHEYPS